MKSKHFLLALALVFVLGAAGAISLHTAQALGGGVQPEGGGGGGGGTLPPVASLSASPTTVATGGGNSTLTWSCTHSNTSTGTNFSTGNALSGSVVVHPTVTTTYTVTCDGDGGSDAASASVTVGSPAPTASLTASPTTVAPSGASTLTWSSTNATSCTGTNFTAGATSGTAVVHPTVTTSYTVTCTGAGGSANSSRTVTVATPPTASLSASPANITAGGSSVLTWSSTNATSCTGTNFSTANATAGSVSVAPTVTTTYTVACTGTGGSANSSATVSITAGGTGGGVKVYDGGQPYSVVAPDAGTNGGVINPTSSGIYWGTGTSPAPEGQRACYLYDPTAYPSYWRAGQYDSPGDNSVIKWNGSIWTKTGASGNPHIKELDCSTLAKADALLTSNKSSMTLGDTATLTWYSQYGSIRQASCTGNSFTTGVFVPAHWESQLDYYNCSGGNTDQNVNLALGGCTPVYSQVWVPDGYTDAEYSGTTNVTPSAPGTYTYTYTCTNANGSNSSSVSIQVAGTTQCTDLVDNDGDGKVDSADPGCVTTPPSCVNNCTNPPEGNEKPDLKAGDVTQSTFTSGVASTLSAVISNKGNSATGAAFTNLFQIDNDTNHATIYATKTDASPALAVNGTDTTSTTYTFPTAGTWYVRACADKSSTADATGVIAESDENNNCSTNDWKTVTVSSPPGGSLSTSPTSVVYGNASTLTWTCTNSTSASIDNGVGAVTPVAGGSISTGALTPSGTLPQSVSFTLTCSGTGTPFNGYSSVQVTSPALTFTANGAATALVRPGDPATITWSTSSTAKNCKVNGSDGYSATGYSGTHTFTNIQNMATYTFSCDGSSPKSVTVSIVPTYKEQ